MLIRSGTQWPKYVLKNQHSSLVSTNKERLNQEVWQKYIKLLTLSCISGKSLLLHYSMMLKTGKIKHTWNEHKGFHKTKWLICSCLLLCKLDIWVIYPSLCQYLKIYNLWDKRLCGMQPRSPMGRKSECHNVLLCVMNTKQQLCTSLCIRLSSRCTGNPPNCSSRAVGMRDK